MSPFGTGTDLAAAQDTITRWYVLDPHHGINLTTEKAIIRTQDDKVYKRYSVLFTFGRGDHAQEIYRYVSDDVFNETQLRTRLIGEMPDTDTRSLVLNTLTSRHLEAFAIRTWA